MGDYNIKDGGSLAASFGQLPPHLDINWVSQI
jgi:hypothetical protein